MLGVKQDETGDIWISVVAGGLLRVDHSTGMLIQYAHDPEDRGSLSDDVVTNIYEDRQGNLWLATTYGLDLFDRVTGSFVHYRNDPSDPLSLGHNLVNVVYQDRMGDLWVGTAGGGVSKSIAALGSFTHYQANPDEAGRLVQSRVFALYEDAPDMGRHRRSRAEPTRPGHGPMAPDPGCPQRTICPGQQLRDRPRP